MQICEEYLKRHSITGVSLFKHISLGYLFLREPSEFGFKWTVLSIFWKEPDHRPGHYLMRFSCPIHDSRSLEMHTMRDDSRVSWDTYEDFLSNWSLKCDKNHVIKTRHEVTLAAWEMFVYSHDSFFAKNYRNLSGLLFGSLDFTSSVKDRIASYEAFLACVDTKSNPFKAWKQTVNIYTKNYCYWLADVIQNG